MNPSIAFLNHESKEITRKKGHSDPQAKVKDMERIGDYLLIDATPGWIAWFRGSLNDPETNLDPV